MSLDALIDETLGKTGQDDTTVGAQGDDTVDAAATTDTTETTTRETQPTTRTAANPPPAGVNTQQLRTDGSGNLIDAAGNVVVKGGAERRVFDNMRRDFAGSVRERDARITELERANAAFRTASETFTRLNVAAHEHEDAARLYAAWRNNPEKTILALIEQAKASGLTVNVEGATSGIDHGAIARIIDQRLAPLLGEHEDRRREIEVNEQASRDVTEFFDAFPDARENETVIAGLMSRSGEDMKTSWLMFKSWCYQHGLDPNTSLEPQLLAKQASNGQAKPTGTDAARTQPATLPPRGNNTAVAASTTVPVSNGTFDALNTRDIVRDAMKQAGINV